MAFHVYLWSDNPGDWRPSAQRDARGGANDDSGNSVSVIQVTNNADFESILRDLIARGQPVDLMEFHTHGSGGVIGLGPDALTAHVIANTMRAKGYDRVFAPNATINLTGCNCAEGAYGELLLVEMARTLLVTGGGQVTGNTGVGIAVGALVSWFMNSGAVWHPFGKWVTAKATPGGAVTLFNHFHLVLDNINSRVLHVEQQLPSLDKADQDPIREKTDKAKTFLPPLAAWEYWNFWSACWYLEQAEQAVYNAHMSQARRLPPAGAPASPVWSGAH